MVDTLKIGQAEVVVGGSQPDTFIDGFHGTVFVNGVLRLTLFRIKFDPVKEAGVREIVGTLSMSGSVAHSVSKVLIEALELHGIAEPKQTAEPE